MAQSTSVTSVRRPRRRTDPLRGTRTATAVAVSLSLAGPMLPGLGAETAGPCEPKVARIVSVQGTVEARRAGAAEWQAVVRNDTFCPGDAIRVQEKSRADVMQLDETLLRLAANTTITIEGVKGEGTSVVDLAKGAAHFLSRSPARVDVQTPFTVAGIRGTEFFVRVADDATLLSIFDGTVVAANDAGSVTLTGGQSAVAERGKAPVLRVVARPRDAVQWALYYPPVVYQRPDAVPAHGGDTRALTDHASQLLAVGSTDEAATEIARALQLDPHDGNALALRAIIAVVQDDKAKALADARQAVAAAPRSAATLIALSYAQQASFDLEGARQSVETALQLEPENALAWARMAELRSSFGELDAALSAARKAAALAPELSRTETVLGFAHLMEVETGAARDAFEQAIALDQADPLPRLGLGLAKIREGDLGAGSRDLEVAASLDPNSSVVHSYLGKAYFEEKRTGLDERQYGVAKELDPLDPTPWFYDAIQKQTTNRPVEALRDFQKAIDLNDNRAVYRSRLLLDADLAARSASLGRIYSDLGFQPLALVEGWKSANTDPTNYSAHRFLADSYSALPRHEIARVSELLQSQLLQPINITPIQPRLAESNLFQISSGGPSGLSFNEFNPLFNRDQVTLQTTGLVGENGTYAGEGVVAGIHRQVSFSVGYNHFETDGFRTNDDHRDDIVDAFVQGELSAKTSIQAEYRYRNQDQGDLQLRFFPQDFRPHERQTAESNTYRVGARHAFSPNSILLASFIHQDLDDTLRDRPPFPPVNSIDVAGHQHSNGGELQHLFRSQYVNVVTGVGHVNVGGEDRSTTELALPDGTVFDTQHSDRGRDHTNAYVYSYLTPVRQVTFTLGGSGDFYSGDSATKKRNQFNPKVGLTWTPLPSTTLRAAVFRVLKRTLITNQTLEPTQVAGFNQFFDDGNATSSWRYGGAVDQKLCDTLFSGLEYSHRKLQVPFQLVDPELGTVSVRDADWTERFGRAYFLWAPHDWVALRLEYLYERFARDREFTFGVRRVDTQRVPMGVAFFHPSGVSASVTGTYVHQHGEFEPNPEEFRTGTSDFFVVDASLSYRLPKRYGFVSVGATNLFDKSFRYHDTDFTSPIVEPDRVVFARVTLALP
jgi:tetratricopeptide (TPR) repeat protein